MSSIVIATGAADGRGITWPLPKQLTRTYVLPTMQTFVGSHLNQRLNTAFAVNAVRQCSGALSAQQLGRSAPEHSTHRRACGPAQRGGCRKLVTISTRPLVSLSDIKLSRNFPAKGRKVET
jgi:hypothetical protein